MSISQTVELKLAYSELYADRKQVDLFITQCSNADCGGDNDTRNDVVALIM